MSSVKSFGALDLFFGKSETNHTGALKRKDAASTTENKSKRSVHPVE